MNAATHAAAGPGLDLELPDVDVVVDDKALDLAGVILGEDAGDSAFQLGRIVGNRAKR